jgi:UDP-glucose 4-epimerase
MKVLITGGSGFIGANLVRHFNRLDPEGEVRVLDNLSNGRRSNLDGTDCVFVEGSILDAEVLSELVSGVDSIVHLGALGSVPRSVAAPFPSHEANASGTLSVLESARANGVDHVVVASSSSVYGANPALPKSEFDWTRPMSPYAVTKLATEGYAIAYGHTYGMKTLAFRLFNVYGPWQPADHDYAAVIPRFIDAALAGRPLIVHGDGTQSRDFTHVETVCSALFDSVARKVESRHPVNLAFGTNTSLLSLIEEIEKTLGVEVKRTHVDTRVGDVRASQSDGKRIRELFPSVAPVPLQRGLAETVEWFTRGQSE